MGKEEAVKHDKTQPKDEKRHFTFLKFTVCTIVAGTSLAIFLFLSSLIVCAAITLGGVFEGIRPWWHLLIVAVGLFALSMFIYSAYGTASDFMQERSAEETNEEK